MNKHPPSLDNRDLDIDNFLGGNQKGNVRSGLNAGILKKTEGRAIAASETSNRDTQNELDVGATRKANYGENRRVPTSAADKKDRVMNLEKENNSLKEKENLLNQEIQRMQTKLRRIDALLKQRSRYGDQGAYDAKDFQNDLKNEVDELNGQNDVIKEKVRKLRVIERGLAAGPALAAKPNKYSHVQGKLEVTHSKVTRQYQTLIEELRAQLVTNQKETLRLENEVRRIRATTGADKDGSGLGNLKTNIQDMYAQIRQATIEMETLQGSFVKNEFIFKESKNFITELQTQIRQVSGENEKLKHANSMLHFESQQVLNLQVELEHVLDERDKIEQSLRHVAAEPFLKSEVGQSIGQRINDLEMKLKEKTGIIISLKAQEQKGAAEVESKRNELASLKGAVAHLQGEHEEARIQYEKTAGTNKGPTEKDALRGLAVEDGRKYAQLMTDLAMGEVGGPQWANLAFLERGNVDKNVTPKERILKELERLRQEKSEFAAELEKAQNLLKLQVEIEKENNVFFHQEVQRLKLVDKSAQMKLEELARRADDKHKQIADLEKKLHPERQGSPLRDSRAARASIDDAKSEYSEFSAITNEPELRNDENILDFCVEDAEFFHETFKQLPNGNQLQQAIKGHKSFYSLVTVDFFNHNSETTQIAEGIRPKYQTQFAFFNTVDALYLAHLQKRSLRMDVYATLNNSNVHIGRCEVFLQELIDQEVHGQDTSIKTPVIQRWAKIYPIGTVSGDTHVQALGQVLYKMRLRRPIKETMRFYREKNEIDLTTRAIAANASSLRPKKQLITISIVKCQNLKVNYSEISQVLPFFYYQFYTFDERYSHNGSGVNPVFNDTFNYEVQVDSKANSYFNKELLEVILFDDNAPIGGHKDNGGVAGQGDDMIGIAKIPLASLVQGCSIHDFYDVRHPSSGEKVGSIEVRISVMELDKPEAFKQTRDFDYTKEWAREVITRIARKLGNIHADEKLIFGIFSRGLRTCTFEDFKYCCLQRLGLRSEMTERELDLFLANNEFTRDKDFMEQQDFVNIFKSAIIQARHEAANRDAFQQTTIQALHHQGDTITHGSINSTHNVSYHENEVMEILADAVVRGAVYKMWDQIEIKEVNGTIGVGDLKAIMRNFGEMQDFDINKVMNCLDQGNLVHISKYNNYIRRAQEYAKSKSKALPKLKAVCQKHGKIVCQRLESQDFNKDGQLNIDGFQAALLISELGISKSDVEESFNLICFTDGLLYYQTWILDNFPHYENYFAHKFVTQRTQSDFSARDTINDRTPLHETSTHQQVPVVNVINSGKLLQARNKMEAFMRSKDMNLSVIFNVLDTNSNDSIDYKEFQSKTKAIGLVLDDQECTALFRNLDKDGSGFLLYKEIVDSFSYLNTEFLLKKMQRIISGSGTGPEFYFNRYSISDASHKQMKPEEFAKLAKELNEKVIGVEINHLYKHFDTTNKGYISKEEFVMRFHDEIQEQQFQISIEDIIKPLATKCRAFKVNVDKLFDLYDKDKNMRLSAEELKDALAKDYNVVLDPNEVKVFNDYFKQKFKTTQIKKVDFIKLLRTEWDRKHDKGEARESLFTIKNKLPSIGKGLDQLINAHNPEGANKSKINMGSFKQALNSLRCLSLYQIENLTKFLDEQNDGFIDIHKFTVSVQNAYAPGSFAKSASLGTSFNGSIATSHAAQGPAPAAPGAGHGSALGLNHSMSRSNKFL